MARACGRRRFPSACASVRANCRFRFWRLVGPQGREPGTDGLKPVAESDSLPVKIYVTVKRVHNADESSGRVRTTPDKRILRLHNVNQMSLTDRSVLMYRAEHECGAWPEDASPELPA